MIGRHPIRTAAVGWQTAHGYAEDWGRGDAALADLLRLHFGKAGGAMSMVDKV